MPHLVHNERIKYAATFVNTIAIGCVVVGVVTPLREIFEDGFASEPVAAGAAAATGDVTWPTVIITLAWLLAGVALHLGVRWILGRLRE